MRRTNRIHWTKAVSLLAVLALAAGCATSGRNVRRHPEFDLRYPEMQTITVAAPDVSLELTKSPGEEESSPLIEDTPRVADDLARLVSEALAEHGLEPVTLRSKELDLQGVAQAVEQSVAAEEAGQTTLSLPGTLREKVASCGESTGIRDLVLISFRGRKRSGGSVAKGFLGKVLVGIGTAGLYVPPGDSSGSSLLFVTIVDTETGNILWANSEYDISIEPKTHGFDTGDLADLVEKVFEPLLPLQPVDVPGLD